MNPEERNVEAALIFMNVIKKSFEKENIDLFIEYEKMPLESRYKESTHEQKRAQGVYVAARHSISALGEMRYRPAIKLLGRVIDESPDSNAIGAASRALGKIINGENPFDRIIRQHYGGQ